MKISNSVLISISLLVLAFAILLKDFSIPLRKSHLNVVYYMLAAQWPPPPNVKYYMLAAQWPPPPNVKYCMLAAQWPPPPNYVECYNMLMAPPPPPPNVHHMLVLQWAPGVCTNDACQINPVPTRFTIHGLWLEPKGAASTDEPFNNKELEIILELMNQNWPSLIKKTNIEFWQHEWDRHGRYLGLGMSEYFEKTLGLFYDVGQGQLVEELAAVGIIPSNTRTYKLWEIEDALATINDGYIVSIICVFSSNEVQIKEIRFNYTEDFKKQNALKHSDDCFKKDKVDPEILFPAPPPPPP